MTEHKQPVKILLAEDDQQILAMYRAKLIQEGFEVQTASDGNSAVEIVNNFRPDVVLLDLMMPHVTGIDFLQNIRGKRQNDSLKIIVLTNIDDPLMHESMRAMGITDYLIKAEVTPSQVVDRIRQVIGLERP